MQQYHAGYWQDSAIMPSREHKVTVGALHWLVTIKHSLQEAACLITILLRQWTHRSSEVDRKVIRFTLVPVQLFQCDILSARLAG